MTLRELHKAAIRNVPMNSPQESAWFRWWLLRGGYTRVGEETAQ